MPKVCQRVDAEVLLADLRKFGVMLVEELRKCVKESQHEKSSVAQSIYDSLYELDSL